MIQKLGDMDVYVWMWCFELAFLRGFCVFMIKISVSLYFVRFVAFFALLFL